MDKFGEFSFGEFSNQEFVLKHFDGEEIQCSQYLLVWLLLRFSPSCFFLRGEFSPKTSRVCCAVAAAWSLFFPRFCAFLLHRGFWLCVDAFGVAFRFLLYLLDWRCWGVLPTSVFSVQLCLLTCFFRNVAPRGLVWPRQAHFFPCPFSTLFANSERISA